MELPVKKLSEPSFVSLLREPEEDHVQELEEEFLRRPDNYFHLMVVNVHGEIDAPFFENCNLEVIGGNHSRKALQNILKRANVGDKSPFQTRLCLVYQNLTPDEAKYIANQHNQVRKLGTDLDVVDRATCFRFALFEKAGVTSINDTSKTNVPTDKKTIQNWKRELEVCMGGISVSYYCIIVSINIEKSH